MDVVLKWASGGVELLGGLFIVTLTLLLVSVAVLYVLDVTQTRHAIRRNYPVLGRFRYLFEHIGYFFRQYFFAMDREELPFNRAERAWVYRAAKDLDSTVAFGSTRNINMPGTVLFANEAFGVLPDAFEPVSEVVLGPYCREPYRTHSFFNVSGMSYGAISRPAVLALSHGAKAAGCWLNTGEGSVSQWHREGGADLVVQIGTAKYGVRDATGNLDEERLKAIAELPTVKMFELKLSQGAKPGKGGMLPGVKVTPEIAAIRGIPVGVDSDSPNGHPDIRSVDDLLNAVERIRQISGKPVGVKAVLGSRRWIDALCKAIQRRGEEAAPDFLTIDGGDGGTGAAPLSLMDNVGLSVRESLPMVVDALLEYGLKERIKVNVSGKLVNPVHVAWALSMGADFVSTARGFMFALGCIQALQCNRNTCPTGVTTHNPRLQKGLVVSDKSVRVANYARNMIKEVAIIAHSCGASEPRQLRRWHARIVMDNGLSVPLDELHPYPAGAGLVET